MRWANPYIISAIVLIGGMAGAELLGGSSNPGSGIPLILRYQGASRLPVPRVPGSVGVDLPRYPHSTISLSGFPDGLMDPISGSPYVREARSATYQVDAGRSTVMAWFTRQFARRGDGSVLPGTLGNYHTGSVESSLSFSKRPGSTLSITMTFYAPAANRTRYAFWVTQVVPPSRPHRTEIPTSLVGLTGAMVTHGQSHSITSRNREALGLLARRTDSLTHLDLGNHCPAIIESASLRLVAKNGSHFSVNIESGCSVTVNGIAWEDYPSKPIWSALMADTQSRHEAGNGS